MLFTKPTKKNYKEDRKSITETSQKMKTFKKRNYANIRNKNMPDADRGRRKEYLKNY